MNKLTKVIVDELRDLEYGVAEYGPADDVDAELETRQNTNAIRRLADLLIRHLVHHDDDRPPGAG